MKYLYLILTLTAVLLFANIHNVYAYFYHSENAVAILSNCKKNCRIKGTLRIKPFDGMFYIERKDESIVPLPDGSYEMIIIDGHE